MIEVDWDGNGSVCARFSLLNVVGAQQIHIVGEFNSWSRTATPMRREGDGFAAEVILGAGRAYRFRYLLDGERWQNDWAADGYVPNEFGGDDSVLDLTRSHRSQRRIAQPLKPSSHISRR